ncbi:hypothetical protein [Spirillospora sp. NPDC029432]|uniref:hypothetical protein n=1 Tax=Spirillospora sp. NPDC029432 TaxID=3154599 RepID=UPI0034521BBA
MTRLIERTADRLLSTVAPEVEASAIGCSECHASNCMPYRWCEQCAAQRAKLYTQCDCWSTIYFKECSCGSC